MKINGTKNGELLQGTAEADTISAGRGNDTIDGGKGNDTLTGGEGRDTFILHATDGNDVVTDFNTNDRKNNLSDQILLDSGSGVWDGQLELVGRLHDGMDFYNHLGGHVATLHAGDFNGDGVMDSQFVMDSGASLTLLGVAPNDLYGYMVLGG